MKLREVAKQDEEKIIEMYDEYLASELIPGMDKFEGIRDFKKLQKLSFNEWFEEIEKNKYEENLPEETSPRTVYLAINDNNKIVGAIVIRWKKVPDLMNYGGLIGYSIRPSERGKGYASEMLKLALKDLKNTNMKNVLITCKDFNTASKRVIEKNGGIFENTYSNANDGYTYLRYWIEI